MQCRLSRRFAFLYKRERYSGYWYYSSGTGGGTLPNIYVVEVQATCPRACFTLKEITPLASSSSLFSCVSSHFQALPFIAHFVSVSNGEEIFFSNPEEAGMKPTFSMYCITVY